MKDQIRQLAAGMEVDETLRTNCPACGGGASAEEAFCITRLPEGLLYQCFRNKCGVKGFITTNGALISANSRQKGNKQHKFEKDIVNISDDMYKELSLKYNLSKEEMARLGVMYVPSDHRYYFPVHDCRGYYIGCTTRRISANSGHKSISYPENPDGVPFAAFYSIGAPKRPIIVVEGQLDAVAASSYLPTVALLGTGLNDVLVGVVSSLTNHLILALDRDALATALKHKEKYGLSFNRVDILVLDKDIKDMTREERTALLGGYVQ